jgi:hypothetical protein
MFLTLRDLLRLPRLRPLTFIILALWLAVTGCFPRLHSDRVFEDNDGDGFDNCYAGDWFDWCLETNDGSGQACDCDCDDSDAAVSPDGAETCTDGVDNDCDGHIDLIRGSLWYADGDGDGHGNIDDGSNACEQPEGYANVPPDDCDDTNPDRYPENPEVPDDGIDQDCSGADRATCYLDADGDGYGDELMYNEAGACDPALNQVTVSGDCNDNDAAYHPGAAEDCSSLAEPDYNCDGSSGYVDTDEDGIAACDDCDDGDPTRAPGFPEDCDGVDNDCDNSVPANEVDGDVDGFLACAECDDSDGLTYPGAPELCDGLVNDCGGALPPDERDTDLDGYLGCEECDDGDAAVNPGAAEACDGVDTDCSGSPGPTEVDTDSDGYLACAECDDSDGLTYPGAPELCDGIDNACAGSLPADEVDVDTDGYLACEECDDGAIGINPGATESCDGSDEDCDGEIDSGATDCPVGCTQDWASGSSYLFCNLDDTWSNAQVTCQSYGYDLVIVNDATEDAYLDATATAINPSKYFFFGLTDSATEGSFLWIDGSTPSYTNWSGGEPDDGGGGSDCAGFSTATSGWSDVLCTGTRGWICEAQ